MTFIYLCCKKEYGEIKAYVCEHHGPNIKNKRYYSSDELVDIKR